MVHEELDPEVRPFRMPPEDVLRFVEDHWGIFIERDAFVSQGYYNPYHPEGKHEPVYWRNNGLGNGQHVPTVVIDHKHYVVGKVPMERKPGPNPIPISGKNPNRER